MARTVDYLEILGADRGGEEHAAQNADTKTVVGAYAEPKARRSVKKKKKKTKTRKLSKAARREISMRNLKKAQAANRRKEARHGGHRTPKSWRAAVKKKGSIGSKRHAAYRVRKQAERASRSRKTHGSSKTLTPRRRARSTTASEVQSMKKGSKRAKGKRKLTKAERADISRRNLRKARAAQKRGGKRGKRGSHSRKIAKSGHLGKGASLKTRKKSRKAVAAPKMPRKPARSSGKRKAARKSPKRSKARKSPKRARSSGARRSGKRRFTAKMRAAALRNLGKARSARRRMKKAGRKHKVRSYSYHRKPARVRVPAHRSYETAGRKKRRSKKQRAASLRNIRKAQSARRGHKRSTRHHKGGRRGYKYAMENPLGGVEIFVGGVSALVWFGLTDLLDRVIATHALSDKGAKDASGHELYADSPPTTGSYAGLFNPTAICAPMNGMRWLAGGAMTVAPIVVAKWITNPLGRSVFQMAGFGAGIRIVGKALIDLVAKLAMWTQTGQRLYDGEMRAMALAAANGSEASLPSAGLGAACDCASCTSGVGACAGCAAGTGKVDDKAGVGSAAGKDAGTGWPSMPREVAGRDGGGYVPPPPAPPVATLPSPGSSAQAQLGPLQGLSGINAVVANRRKSPYGWGAKEDERDAA